MSPHAACSPSSAAMWMACSASVTLTRDMVRPSSRYAKEGTAAHKVAELTLQGDIFLPDKVEIEGDEFIVSPGMCRALGPTSITSRASRPCPVPRLCWRSVSWSLTPRHGLGHARLRRPCPGDLSLSISNSARALPSSLTARSSSSTRWRWRSMSRALADTAVMLTICQPRVGDQPLRSYYASLGGLRDWSEMAVRPAVRRIKAGDTTENAGLALPLVRSQDRVRGVRCQAPDPRGVSVRG